MNTEDRIQEYGKVPRHVTDGRYIWWNCWASEDWADDGMPARGNCSTMRWTPGDEFGSRGRRAEAQRIVALNHSAWGLVLVVVMSVERTNFLLLSIRGVTDLDP